MLFQISLSGYLIHVNRTSDDEEKATAFLSFAHTFREKFCQLPGNLHNKTIQENENKKFPVTSMVTSIFVDNLSILGRTDRTKVWKLPSATQNCLFYQISKTFTESCALSAELDPKRSPTTQNNLWHGQTTSANSVKKLHLNFFPDFGVNSSFFRGIMTSGKLMN